MPPPSNHYDPKSSSPISLSYSFYLSQRNIFLTKSLIRIGISENQVTHLLAALYDKFIKDEGRQDRLEKTEGKNKGIKGNVRKETQESYNMERNKIKCNEKKRRGKKKRLISKARKENGVLPVENTSLLELDFKGLAKRTQGSLTKEIWDLGRRNQEVELEIKVKEEATKEFEKERDRNNLLEEEVSIRNKGRQKIQAESACRHT